MAWELAADRGSGKYAKLTMNELSFGPLPEARAAAAEALLRANRYPERDADALREAISASTLQHAGARDPGQRVERGARRPLQTLERRER